jgi:hypothetical protein
MRSLIGKVKRIMPETEPDFDKKRLALILGGRLAKQSVKGWMVDTPEEVDDDKKRLALILASISDDISLMSSTSGDVATNSGEQAGALALAHFLLRITSLHLQFLLAYHGPQASEAL